MLLTHTDREPAYGVPLQRTLSLPRFPFRLVDRSFSSPAFQRTPSVPHCQNLDVFIVRSVRSGLAKQDDYGLVEPNDAEVFQEEPVCRICMLQLNEGNETFKMECSCKGDLALAHKECTIKWFSMKGNNQCDVCNTRVCNLPVLLFRQSSSLCRNNFHVGDGDGARENSSWRQTVMVLLSSTLESLWHKLEELSEFP